MLHLPAKRALLIGRQVYFNFAARAITPALGDELLTDPGLEANYTAGLCDSLVKSGSPTVSQSADAHGGSKAQVFTGTAADDNVAWTKTIAVGWYQLSMWAKRTAGTTGDAYMNLGIYNEDNSLTRIDQASYTQKAETRRATGSNAAFVRAYTFGTSAWDTVIIDDGSLKAFTLSTLLSDLGDVGQKNGTYYIKHGAVSTGGYYKGGRICVSPDGDYALHAYTNRTNVTLVKREAGTETVLIDTATGVTYADNRRIKVTISGNRTVTLYYESAANTFTQIGTPQTVTLTPYGTRVQGFSTESASDISAEVNV